MLLSLYTWDGNAINDGTNFVAVIPPAETMPSANPFFVDRGQSWPFLAGKTLNGGTFTFQIVLKGTVHSQLETLKTYFRTDDFVFRRLIAKDTADSDRQWYIEGYATMPPTVVNANGSTAVNVTLALKEPIWRENSQQTDTWSITASGQTRAITARGAYPALPVFTITPTNAKTGGYGYKRFVTIYNQSTVPCADYPYALTLNTSALVADTAVSNQINNVSGITAAALTIAIDTPVGGGLPTTGGICYVDSEQIYYTSISGGTMTVPAGGRGWGGTTAATHADNAVMRRSKIMANGNDYRLVIDGSEADRWLDAMNTTATKMWFNLTLKAEVELTINAAIAGSGAVATITFQKTTANQSAIKLLPVSGLLLIDSELFEYSALNISTRTATIQARNSRGTSMGAHTVGATARWIEHDIWLMYGNSQDTAPVVDDTYKPAMDLTSTNISWVYTIFGAQNGRRTGAWKPALLKSLGRVNTYFYFGTQRDLVADPITDAGMTMGSYQSAGVWKAETAALHWKLYNPFGFTTLSSASGYKYRTNTSWPTLTQFQKSNNGAQYTIIGTAIATPASAASWTTWSIGSTSLSGNWKYIRLFFSGSQTAGPNAYCALEAGAATVVPDSAAIPSNTIQAEASNYTLDLTLTNTTTSEYITLTAQTTLNVAITIDCENQLCYRADGENLQAALGFSSKRTEWLTLAGGSNTLSFVDVGTSAVTCVTTHNGRNLI